VSVRGRWRRGDKKGSEKKNTEGFSSLAAGKGGNPRLNGSRRTCKKERRRVRGGGYKEKRIGVQQNVEETATTKNRQEERVRGEVRIKSQGDPRSEGTARRRILL